MINIEIEQLSYTYPSGVAALRGISLKIPAGESLAIVGQNGAGKTTLVKHFNGLLKPTAGGVRVGGRDTRGYSTAQMAQWVGYVFQNPDDQQFQFSVKAEVMFGPVNLGWERARVDEQSDRALEIVQLVGIADRHPYDLPPGERKRVALAAVLAMDTPIVILDEPTTGQDYVGVELVGRIVEELKGEGKTVVTISHDIDFCAEHFGCTVVMSGGEVLLDGPTRKILSQTEILAQSYVELPQIMRLANRLKLGSLPLTVEEFILRMRNEG
jgi:energy-coupling factor transport system ATP-binding protein